MSLDTVSLFDSMELDDTTHRVASRRALALAHHRIESNLGRFLRAAHDEEEFFERLALVQDDFGGYVVTAAQEVGYDHPEHTAAAIVRHYAVDFEKTPAEEELEDQENDQPEGREASRRRWTPRVAGPNAMGGGFDNRALLDQMSQSAGGGTPGMETHPDYQAANPCPDCGSPLSPAGDCPSCAMAGRFPSGHRAGKQSAPLGVNPQQGQLFAPDAGGQQSLGGTCPGCGGPIAPGQACPNCGMRANDDLGGFGDELGGAFGMGRPSPHPMSGEYRQQARQPGPWAEGKTADDQNNTGLGGPEPTMNKSQGPGSRPDVPGKIEEKDILKPIFPKDNTELKEIGDIKHESLPSNSSDEPFSTGGEEHGPHTDTWSDKGQADPVTRESLSSANPLVALLDDPWPSDDLVKAAFERS